MTIFSKPFWKDTAERTISSAAQGALTGWGAAAFTDISQVVSTVEAAGFGALSFAGLTFLKCLVASNVGGVTPSFVNLGDKPAPPAPAADPAPAGGTP